MQTYSVIYYGKYASCGRKLASFPDVRGTLLSNYFIVKKTLTFQPRYLRFDINCLRMEIKMINSLLSFFAKCLSAGNGSYV